MERSCHSGRGHLVHLAPREADGGFESGCSDIEVRVEQPPGLEKVPETDLVLMPRPAVAAHLQVLTLSPGVAINCALSTLVSLWGLVIE